MRSLEVVIRQIQIQIQVCHQIHQKVKKRKKIGDVEKREEKVEGDDNVCIFCPLAVSKIWCDVLTF